MGRESTVELKHELEPDSHRREMADDVRGGLGSNPKLLPAKYFYDDRGSKLFEAITRLPEYYQTRTERTILQRAVPEIVGAVSPRALVEFGSGAAGKTEVLLGEMHRAGLLEGYAPIDVSPEAVRATSERLAERYPGVRVVGIIGDFDGPLPLPFRDEPRLIAFLGSTIGNFEASAAVDFLSRVKGEMKSSDAFLLGFDLVKDRETLEAAYNDGARVTAEFNLNVLRVLNRELDADFDLDAFRHRAFWNEEEERIEMHLVSERDQTVRVTALDMEVEFGEGESIRTELSHKYTRDSAEGLLRDAGLELQRWDTDPDELFALALAKVA